ncbi:hypothetical protein PEC302107_05240 [Pectobacterium araliae]|nr:hypothetical protein PEC302107_05240 [Pectobacterium carotovorum subsp. carotovorum]
MNKKTKRTFSPEFRLDVIALDGSNIRTLKAAAGAEKTSR